MPPPGDIPFLHRLSLDEQEQTAREFLEFALDLRWSWSHEGDAIWRHIDAEAWEATRNPHRVIQNLDAERVVALFDDPRFREEWSKLVAKRSEYLNAPGWGAGARDALFDHGTVAYFSMEFGLGEALPLYAGGLGVLAGDYLKAASDLDVPIVGVGLLYQQGYFRQLIDDGGRQQEVYTYNDSTAVPVRPARGKDGAWAHVDLRFPGRRVRCRVWQAQVGRVRLYLLDSNDPLNGAVDRGITARLYAGGEEMRLLQEIALGIGGWRALQALDIPVTICHLNEGHAAFAALERAREYALGNDLGFWDALRVTRVGNVFTTHTPVRAAFHAFPMSLARKYGTSFATELDVEPDDLAALGCADVNDPDEPYSMTRLALNTSGRINGVSRLHAEVSRREVFSSFFPRWPHPQVPVTHVTNGVHVPSWDSAWADRLWTAACGKGPWLGAVDRLGEAIGKVSDEELWELSGRQRADLVHFARRELAQSLKQGGKDPDPAVDAILDPNALTLGFARRFTEYKRPNLLLRDESRLLAMLTDPARPVQIILAGKAHPDDWPGKALIAEWIRFRRESGARERIVFIEDYDITIAQQLVQGVDVWLNTPQQQREACGTSGMKVLVNGGLNLSIPDGWWAEAYDPRCGWVIPLSKAATQQRRDADEMEALYRLLEREIIPLFYTRDSRGIPTGWVAKMRASLSQLTAFYSTNRMLREYFEVVYTPAVEQFRARSSRPRALARELERWERNLRDHWREIHIGQGTAARDGQLLHVELPVALGDVDPEGVAVEIYADADAALPTVCERLCRDRAMPGTTNGYFYVGQLSEDRPISHLTPRVVPYHPDALVPLELALIEWSPTPLAARHTRAAAAGAG